MSQKPRPKRALQETRTGREGRSIKPPSPVPASSAAAGLSAEDLEPQADSSLMPFWFFIALIMLAYWGMIHLDRYGGGFSAQVYAPYQSFRQLSALQPKSGPELLAAKGESLYAMVCLACHQATGMGSPGQYPPLAGSEWVAGSPGRLIRVPLHGLTGPIQVKGQQWTGLNMPAFGMSPPLDDDENLAAVLTYIRQAWGNSASPISPEQVRFVRAETAGRTAPWTAADLQALPE